MGYCVVLTGRRAGSVAPPPGAQCMARGQRRHPRALEVGRDARLPAYACSATESELTGVAAVAGITFGSHTWSHPNLAALEAQPLDAELHRPLAWLRERYEGVLPVLTYPYGLHGWRCNGRRQRRVTRLRSASTAAGSSSRALHTRCLAWMCPRPSPRRASGFA